MKKLFNDIHMSWKNVILFGLVVGIYVGCIMCVPVLDGTSFQDIGISHEWWILFALIIVTNCKKSYEAALKCFVFFLVSQPMVFIVEALFGHITWDLAFHYYFDIWFVRSLFTLPGGLIAYYVQKQNALGAIVLGIGNTLEALLGMYYGYQAFISFPHHFLTAIFCFFVIGITNLYIQKEKKNRIISIITTVLLIAVMLVFLVLDGRVIFS